MCVLFREFFSFCGVLHIMPEEGPALLALKQKRLQYVSVNTDDDKVRTLIRHVLPGRRCIIICQNEQRAKDLAEVLNDIHRERGHFNKLTMFIDGNTTISKQLQSVVVSANGAALTEKEAADFDTFVMHDNPRSTEQYKNWAWHSYCKDIVSFLVNAPEEQNIRENYILDQLETNYQCHLTEFDIPERHAPPPSAAEYPTGSSQLNMNAKQEEQQVRLGDERFTTDQAKIQQMQAQHRDETRQLQALMEDLIAQQQKQQQQMQQQQEQQQELLLSQIKSLEGLLAQQQVQQQQQQEELERQLQMKIKELEQRDRGHDKDGAANPVQQLLSHVNERESGTGSTAQQVVTAEATSKALALQQLQAMLGGGQVASGQGSVSGGPVAMQSVEQIEAQVISSQLGGGVGKSASGGPQFIPPPPPSLPPSDSDRHKDQPRHKDHQKEYKSRHKDYHKDYHNEYHNDYHNDYHKDYHKDYHNDYHKDYHKDYHNDYHKDYRKDYREDYHKDYQKDYHKDYQPRHKDYQKDYQKGYQKDYRKDYHEDYHNDYQKDCHKDYQPRHKDYQKDYHKEYPQRYKDYHKDYERDYPSRHKDWDWWSKESDWHSKDSEWRPKGSERRGQSEWREKDNEWRQKEPVTHPSAEWREKEGKGREKDAEWHSSQGKARDKDAAPHHKDSQPRQNGVTNARGYGGGGRGGRGGRR